MHLGLDILISKETKLLTGKRVGILAHGASRNRQGKHILQLLNKKSGWEVTTLFGPEHGFDTQAQDMEPIPSGVHKPSGLPLYSLYGSREASLKPIRKMLQDIDLLVVDLQDVGARYYTYVWTTLLCMQACSEAGKKVVLCDRPNPINGEIVEGETIYEGFTSFVGLYPIPVRHGMTIGEICRFINDVYDINCDLTVVPMIGWQRIWYWDQTDLVWQSPSPNMATLSTALVYPGTCLIEATNVSEGRGTESPFEVVGAPWVDSTGLIKILQGLRLPAVVFESIDFKPARQKFKGELCHGVRLLVTNRLGFKPYLTGIALVWALHELYAEREVGFQWREGAYEFEEERSAIDLLTGGPHVREALESGVPFQELAEWMEEPPSSFLRQRAPYLLY